MVDAAERSYNGRHRRTDDRRFESGYRHAGHNADDDDPSPLIRHFEYVVLPIRRLIICRNFHLVSTVRSKFVLILL